MVAGIQIRDVPPFVTFQDEESNKTRLYVTVKREMEPTNEYIKYKKVTCFIACTAMNILVSYSLAIT